MQGNKKYITIYQASNSSARSIYLSYQRIIAQIKEDLLNHTGITLEEWIYLSKITPNLYIEGGLRYKRYKGIHEPDKRFKQILDYDFEIDWSDL